MYNYKIKIEDKELLFLIYLCVRLLLPKLKFSGQQTISKCTPGALCRSFGNCNALCSLPPAGF